MADFSLYQRVTRQGTLSEPKGVPQPHFALPSTVNWMRALSILVRDHSAAFASAKATYQPIGIRKFSDHEANTIFEQLLFALHQLSALQVLDEVSKKTDVARVGIVGWYYGIYAAASAMVAGQDGSFQDNHTQTANSWDRQIASRGLALPPFALRVSSLVKKDVDQQVDDYRNGNDFKLTKKPQDPDQAFGAACGYLSGTAGWLRWKIEEELKESKEFRDLGFANFRKSDAQKFRDSRLEKKQVCFLHQASRYRGKANYREALFLGYGRSVETTLDGFVSDLAAVLEGFVIMAGAFTSRRLGKQLWSDFVQDVEAHRAFSCSPKDLWS